MENKTSNRLIAFTILSISFLQTMTTSTISPALGRIAGEFSTVSMSTVQLTMTISSICTIVLSLAIGALMARFSIKSLFTFGITLYLIGGVAGFFVDNMNQLIASRLVLGVGLGIFSPMITIAISKFYGGIERSKLMGYVQSSNFLGGIVGTIYAGAVTGYGWRYIFLIYLAAAVPLLLTVVLYPSERRQEQSPPENGSAHTVMQVPKGKIPFVCYGFGICMTLYAMIFFKAPLTLAMYLPEIGVANPTYAGIVSGILYFFSFLAGLILIPLSKALRKSIFPVSFLVMALAM